MSIESAEDLAGFFVLEEFAQRANYQAVNADAPVVVTVIMGLGDASLSLGLIGVSGPVRVVQVTAAEVAAPARGDRVWLHDVEAPMLTVRRAELDELGVLWRLDCSQ